MIFAKQEGNDDAGLSNFIDESNKVGIRASELKDAYLKRFYRSWLDAMIPKYPAVNSFRRRNHESLIEEFNTLDLLQMKIARSRIRKSLFKNCQISIELFLPEMK